MVEIILTLIICLFEGDNLGKGSGCEEFGVDKMKEMMETLNNGIQFARSFYPLMLKYSNICSS